MFLRIFAAQKVDFFFRFCWKKSAFGESPLGVISRVK